MDIAHVPYGPVILGTWIKRAKNDILRLPLPIRRAWTFALVDEGRIRAIGPGGHDILCGPGTVLCGHRDARIILEAPPGSEVRVIAVDPIHRERQPHPVYGLQPVTGAPTQPSPHQLFGFDLPWKFPANMAPAAARCLRSIADTWWRRDMHAFLANQRFSAWLTDLVATRLSQRSNTPTDDIIEQAERFARTAFPAGCSVASMAREVGLSRTHFHARYRAARREGPGAFLTRLRMTSARQRLLDTDDDLARIARGSGYRNLSAFARAFTAHEGVSPARWRRMHR